MAKVIKYVARHSCQEELRKTDIITAGTDKIYYGSIAECSCGKQFVWVNEQRDGDYWRPLQPAEYHGPI